MSKEDIASVLRGNTLRVYWFLLRAENGVVGARESQTPLRFPSPALAVYNLDKLRAGFSTKSTRRGSPS